MDCAFNSSKVPDLRESQTLNPSTLVKGISETGVFIALTMFMPFVVHLFPSWDDSPIGAKFIPIFYAPLIAAMTRRLHVSLLACALSPWINYFVFDRPPLLLATLLCIQLIPFALTAFMLNLRHFPSLLLGPTAFLLSKICMALPMFMIPFVRDSLDVLNYLIQSTITAFPGILILALLGYFSHRFHPPSSHA
jgi:magnesium-transporting ATPase (P-type)